MAVEVPASVSLAPTPPAELSDREYAAFRLGSIQTLLSTVEAEAGKPPAAIYLDTLRAEVEYLEWMLATEE